MTLLEMLTPPEQKRPQENLRRMRLQSEKETQKLIARKRAAMMLMFPRRSKSQ